MDRRQFLARGAATTAGAVVLASGSGAQAATRATAKPAARPPRQPAQHGPGRPRFPQGRRRPRQQEPLGAEPDQGEERRAPRRRMAYPARGRQHRPVPGMHRGRPERRALRADHPAERLRGQRQDRRDHVEDAVGSPASSPTCAASRSARDRCSPPRARISPTRWTSRPARSSGRRRCCNEPVHGLGPRHPGRGSHLPRRPGLHRHEGSTVRRARAPPTRWTPRPARSRGPSGAAREQASTATTPGRAHRGRPAGRSVGPPRDRPRPRPACTGHSATLTRAPTGPRGKATTSSPTRWSRST